MKRKGRIMFLKEYVTIAMSSVLIYVFIVAAIRFLGKKELSQLSLLDFVFILLISNSVQNAMVGSNSTLFGGIVAASSLFIVNHLFNILLFKFPRLGRFVQGEAIMLIYNGQVNNQNLTKAMISLDELKEAAREHGVAHLEDIELAVLEADGNISIISGDYEHRTVKKRKTKYNKNNL